MVQLDHPTNVQMYWIGYNQGLQGMSRRNLYSGDQARTYDLGFDEGQDIYRAKRRQVDVSADTSGPRVINQVLRMRDEIERHQAEITQLEELIRKLEAG